MQLYFFETKLPNLKLKTRPKQLLGYLPLVMALPDIASILSLCLVQILLLSQAILLETMLQPF